MANWILEGYFRSGSNRLQRIPLKEFPVMVGRAPELSVSINSSEVSRTHASFYEEDQGVFLQDNNSTNGTFVNRQRISSAVQLKHGDVIHFANVEARLLDEQEEALTNSHSSPDGTIINLAPLGNRLPTGLSALQTILNENAVYAQYQPIVDIEGQLYGFESLGRGSRRELPSSPYELFRIAESMEGKARELSELMRLKGVQGVAAAGYCPRLFVNTHPEELGNMKGLLDNLISLRRVAPNVPMTIEIHEDGIADIASMKSFAEALVEHRFELAFDDFGAGQSRLSELADISVHYVKFDIALIRGLPDAGPAKQTLVSSLCDMTRAMGVKVLAEGVETVREFELCREMKFDFIQGYYFGKPKDDLSYQNPLKRTR